MNRFYVTSFVLLAALLVGCAATPRSYDADASRALNLARAGGIYDQDLRDSPNGTRSYREGLALKALNLASLATSLDAPLRHLNGSQTLAFNAADILLKPAKPSARPSLMGWMPERLADSEIEAHGRYVAIVDAAITQAGDAMALKLTKLTDVETPVIDGYPLMLWAVEADRYGCPAGSCVVAFNIKSPHHWKAPDYVVGAGENSYNITANHPENYSRLVFRQSGEEHHFPTDDLYSAISAALPPWMVLYFPPNSVIEEGELISYPVLYEQGQQLMFKEPQP